MKKSFFSCVSFTQNERELEIKIFQFAISKEVIRKIESWKRESRQKQKLSMEFDVFNVWRWRKLFSNHFDCKNLFLELESCAEKEAVDLRSLCVLAFNMEQWFETFRFFSGNFKSLSLRYERNLRLSAWGLFINCLAKINLHDLFSLPC